MSILSILQYPDPRLATQAELVTEFDKSVQGMIHDMLETLHHSTNCAGLAATQLDIQHPKRITVIYDYRNPEVDPVKTQSSLCLVNPEIIDQEGTCAEPEGCMSVPGGVYEPVMRAEKVVVQALDQEGNRFEIVGEGFMSKLLQHEIDHLNGIIFIDHLSKLKRTRIDKKILKLNKRVHDEV